MLLLKQETSNIELIEIVHYLWYNQEKCCISSEMPASAGPGNFLEDNIDTQETTVTNPDCSFAVKISGDSMEPNIIDGSVALVKKCENVPNAHVGIVWYQGKSYCKKIVQKEDGLLLVSINKAYTPIEVISYEDWRVFGEVIDVIPPNYSNNQK